MTWRCICVVVMLLTLFTSKTITLAQTLPAGFARNPYGVAGSPGALKSLSMPATSSFYDWTPKEKARYITVRPYCPPRDCDGTKPWEVSNYWFWDAPTNAIGHSQADRVKFAEFVQRNVGAVWIIGNEPDSRAQDNLTPADYAKMYRTYYQKVKQLDPSATFAIASITGATYHKEFPHMQAYYDSVFSEYQRLYGSALSFDFWNLHAYYLGWLPEHPREPQAMVDLVFARIISPYLAYRQTVANGVYATKPILATEIGIVGGNNNALGITESTAIDFMRLFTARLLSLVEAGSVADFFWFYAGWAPENYLLTSLLGSDWQTPTALGVAYAQEARTWDRKFGLERADFNQDKKIGILDFSGLVKVFGTNNALLSLDSDPKITRSDIAIFKQVWNFIE